MQIYQSILLDFLNANLKDSNIDYTKLNDNELSCLIKELFNIYFKNHLYGKYDSEKNIILSTGSVDHQIYNIPKSLKYFIDYALKREWYGYSDSRGRLESRQAIANYENIYFKNSPYNSDNICLTLGATQAISSLSGFLANELPKKGTALCATPNYPPLIKSIGQNFNLKLVNINYLENDIDLTPLINNINSDIKLIFLQTVVNPSGKKVSEKSLNLLINSTPEDTIIILDECHECFGPKIIDGARLKSNVIRINSLSKEFLSPGLKIGWFVASKLFIEKYYEFASTNYGSPASIFYLLIEALAIFEMHYKKNVKLIDCNYFSQYEISKIELQNLYDDYVKHSKKNHHMVLLNRAYTVNTLRNAGFEVIDPTHSINVLVKIPENKKDYKAFLELLINQNVSVYPGILSFILNDSYIRISPNIEKELLKKGLEKIINYYKNEQTIN